MAHARTARARASLACMQVEGAELARARPSPFNGRALDESMVKQWECALAHARAGRWARAHARGVRVHAQGPVPRAR
jgi:hypothetical protein